MHRIWVGSLLGLLALAVGLAYFFAPKVTEAGCRGGYVSMFNQLKVDESKVNWVPLLVPDTMCKGDCEIVARSSFNFSYQFTTLKRAQEILQGSVDLDFLSETYEIKDGLGQSVTVHIQDIVYPPNPSCHNVHPKKISESDCWKIEPPKVHYRILRGFSRPSRLNLGISKCLLPQSPQTPTGQ